MLPVSTVLCYTYMCLLYCVTRTCAYCTVLPVPTVLFYLCLLYYVTCVYCTVLPVPTVLCYLCRESRRGRTVRGSMASSLCPLRQRLQGGRASPVSTVLLRAQLWSAHTRAAEYGSTSPVDIMLDASSSSWGNSRYHFPCGCNAGCLFLFIGQFQVSLPLWM
jgi:hypothetical protein